MVLPTGEVLRAKSLRSLVVAFQASAAAGFGYPNSATCGVAEFAMRGVEDAGNVPFWHPYAVTASGLCLKPWFSSTMAYAASTSGKSMSFRRPAEVLRETMKMLDPADWRANVANLIGDASMGADLRKGLQQVIDLYFDPEEGSHAKSARDYLDAVSREAIAAGSMVYATSRARLMIARSAQ